MQHKHRPHHDDERSSLPVIPHLRPALLLPLAVIIAISGCAGPTTPGSAGGSTPTPAAESVASSCDASVGEKFNSSVAGGITPKEPSTFSTDLGITFKTLPSCVFGGSVIRTQAFFIGGGPQLLDSLEAAFVAAGFTPLDTNKPHLWLQYNSPIGEVDAEAYSDDPNNLLPGSYVGVGYLPAQ
jgi:hypothetical protein